MVTLNMISERYYLDRQEMKSRNGEKISDTESGPNTRPYVERLKYIFLLFGVDYELFVPPKYEKKHTVDIPCGYTYEDYLNDEDCTFSKNLILKVKSDQRVKPKIVYRKHVNGKGVGGKRFTVCVARTPQIPKYDLCKKILEKNKKNDDARFEDGDLKYRQKITSPFANFLLQLLIFTEEKSIYANTIMYRKFEELPEELFEYLYRGFRLIIAKSKFDDDQNKDKEQKEKMYAAMDIATDYPLIMCKKLCMKQIDNIFKYRYTCKPENGIKSVQEEIVAFSFLHDLEIIAQYHAYKYDVIQNKKLKIWTTEQLELTPKEQKAVEQEMLREKQCKKISKENEYVKGMYTNRIKLLSLDMKSKLKKFYENFRKERLTTKDDYLYTSALKTEIESISEFDCETALNKGTIDKAKKYIEDYENELCRPLTLEEQVDDFGVNCFKQEVIQRFSMSVVSDMKITEEKEINKYMEKFNIPMYYKKDIWKIWKANPTYKIKDVCCSFMLKTYPFN